MFELLRDGPLPNRGEIAFPEFRRVQTGLAEQIERVVQYHQQNARTVPNGHLLIKLLMSLNIPITLEPEIYNDKVRDVALNVARSLRMTCALSEGQVFSPGVFYGEHVTEVIWAHMDEYDVVAMRKNWRAWSAVEVLYHPRTDLALEVPNGRCASQEAGMAVIAVNVPMLATQYRLWREEQAITHSVDQRTGMQFLMEVPLPRMLASHVDIVLLNRLIARFFNVELPVFKSRHPFALTDWTSEVDRSLDRVLQFMSGRAMSFDQMVSQIPTVSALDLHERVRLPDLCYMRQVQWAVVISRLALTTFLVQYNAQTNNASNRTYLNYLRRYFTQMDMGGSLRAALPAERYNEIRSLIETGIEPYL